MLYQKTCTTMSGKPYVAYIEGAPGDERLKKLGYVPVNSKENSMADGEANVNEKKPKHRAQLKNEEKDAVAAELIKYAKTKWPELTMPTLRKVTSTMYRLIGKQIK